MKARVFRVFKNSDYRIKGTYVDAAKFHDDVVSYDHFYYNTPMMEIRIFRSDETLEEEKLDVFASPEVIKKYTGFDMFNSLYSYSIYGRVIDIEFEWVEAKYPYLKVNDRRDENLTDKYKFPKIAKIEEAVLDFG